MKARDFQTLSLFAILGLLTVAFVFVTRAVLYAPSGAEKSGVRIESVSGNPIAP